MCGSDTFAMLVSSTSMNVAIVTTRAMTHGLRPPGPARREVGRGARRGAAVGGGRGRAHRTLTCGSTRHADAQAVHRGCPGSSWMRTGMRCTTFT